MSVANPLWRAPRMRRRPTSARLVTGRSRPHGPLRETLHLQIFKDRVGLNSYHVRDNTLSTGGAVRVSAEVQWPISKTYTDGGETLELNLPANRIQSPCFAPR